jgi:putative transposase
MGAVLSISETLSVKDGDEVREKIQSKSMTLYKDKYRVESRRLREYDYSSPGFYFVTICTKGMVRWFGKVKSGAMVLNEYGSIAEDEWKKTAIIRPDVGVDAFVVMPNHVHGIVVIKHPVTATHSCASLQRNNVFGPQSMNLASIIRGFKSATTRRIHEIYHNDFEWQPRYHDFIIRNQLQLNNIREYIRANPKHWTDDMAGNANDAKWMD